MFYLKKIDVFIQIFGYVKNKKIFSRLERFYRNLKVYFVFYFYWYINVKGNRGNFGNLVNVYD